MRCAIYARVSTEMDSQKESIINQVSYFKHYVEEREWTISDIYKDEGKSGTSIKDRDEIKRLMKDAKDRKFECVLIKSISRFARDNKDGFMMKRELDDLGIRVIFIEQNLDTFTSDGELLFGIHLNLAQQETKQLSERTSFGKREKARRGEFNGSLPPFGYTKDGNKLLIDRSSSDIVKLIYKLYLEGWGFYRIGKYLDSMGIPTPRATTGGSNAGDKWVQSSLKIILTNPVYTGDMIQNKSKKIALSSEKRRVLPKEDQIIVSNAHEAIMSRDEFNAVQHQLKIRKQNRTNGNESLFAHVAFCSCCGAGMHYKKDRNSYVCGQYSKYGKTYCTSHKIIDNSLLEKVKTSLRSLTTTINMDTLARKVSKNYQKQHTSLDQELNKIEGRIKALTNKQSLLLDLLSEGNITKSEWSQQNSNIREEINALNSRKLELQSQLIEVKDIEDDFYAFRSELTKLINLDLNNENILKVVLTKLIKRIEVFEDGEIKIYYNFKNPCLDKVR